MNKTDEDINRNYHLLKNDFLKYKMYLLTFSNKFYSNTKSLYYFEKLTPNIILYIRSLTVDMLKKTFC